MTEPASSTRDGEALPSLEVARDASLVALGDAWTELRGYVQAAYDDGTTIDPASFAAYMDELRTRARKPLRDVIQSLGRDHS